ncbi:multi-sensor hybrid histidine kinase [Sphingomonas laterariae]|uniref:histidine kinase n=1 Tax=Edaphosphingomonas laterariae TaxID=861865 RepID=A0A239CU44_9SPHN|nr:PAS domain-containing sensor histidine kinase [Sphingomonas laterariae]SNS23382.1 multi-sensor hybrid histidine kinase [Sphingomonas laterariae]
MATASPPLTPPDLRTADRPILWGVLAIGLVTALLLLWLLGDLVAAGIFIALFCSTVGLVVLYASRRSTSYTVSAPADIGLMSAAINDSGDAVAITDRAGRLICASRVYGEWFPGLPSPPGLAIADNGDERLAQIGRAAWRDGSASLDGLASGRGRLSATVMRAGLSEDHLVWRLRRMEGNDLTHQARRLVEGDGGVRLGAAGVMAAIVDGGGRIVSANRVFLQRALGDGNGDGTGQVLAHLLDDSRDLIRFHSEGANATPLRVIQVPLDDGIGESPTLFLLLDDAAALRPAVEAASGHIEALLAMLPLGLALAERDGRILFMNEAFRRAAGLPPGQPVLYPSDLVVKEDKAAVADAVRRFAAGQRMSGDIAVRLRYRADEPVALTIAGARGLGEAAALLSLKDNSEESRLKNQVAQATKMQAVGQLAGGVAHDFNNILTAIIGHCDLMLLRHRPGESDYDDIQQIRQNSNRAAGLTRQLLAFSRQQTLRPQILQLPDVISEISNLIKRLMGEQVKLIVKHGRNLGQVRADPGQLEQVIVNLAVNARDAMPGGGTLTIQTYAVSAAEVRRLNSDILPVADYTALSVSDTGTGIPPELLGKIFEPFFTTKEVGKGTGLGLSTVYGIVKQSGGFIFADSKPGDGTSFVIYLPVHRADPVTDAPPVPTKKPKQGELWGTGTILLVEDEDMVRAVAERALTRQGYKVLTAANGEEALEVLEAMAAEDGEVIDLLVSDVVMPTMDGPTLVRHAREKFPQLPILFMSGYAEEQLRRSIDLDRVAFLAKPFSVQQLAEAARDALVQNKG